MTSAINHYQLLNTRGYRLKTPDWRYYPFGLVILMSLIDPVQSTTNCNSFPKIFGGSSGHTGLDDIDVYKDYLALAGGT
jgi:hypothetical protein